MIKYIKIIPNMKTAVGLGLTFLINCPQKFSNFYYPQKLEKNSAEFEEILLI